MIASFPMYDFDPLRQATDMLWRAIAVRLAARGIPAPNSLLRGVPAQLVWTDPALLLAQTCGYPLVTSLAGTVRLVATPCYRAPGCEGACYRSAVVVRSTDPAAGLADVRGRVCAVNEAGSNSGMNLLRAAIAPVAAGAPRFFADVVMTGGHAASMAAVAAGRADVAAIDCVTWAHAKAWHLAGADGLRVLAWTAATPGLPLVTAAANDAPVVEALRAALDEVAVDAALAAARAVLLLDGFLYVPLDAYDVVLQLERQASAVGYPVLR